MTKPEKLYTLTLTESEARDIVNAWGLLIAYMQKGKTLTESQALDLATMNMKAAQRSKSCDSGDGSTTGKLNQMLDEMIDEALDRLV